MEFTEKLFNLGKNEKQKAVGKVSIMLAELFNTKQLTPHVVFMTSSEIGKDKGRGLVTHNESYIRNDGEIVICENPATSLNKKADLYASLAAELSHLYYKAVGGDNTPQLEFNFEWVDKTRLRQLRDREELALPKPMIEELCLPMAKKEVPDLYCQLYVLDKIGKSKEVLRKESEENKWHEIIEYDINQIKKLEEMVGGYDKLRESFRIILKECMLARKPLEQHQAFLSIKTYFHLASGIAYWLSRAYRERAGKDVEDFRKFVRTPILPITIDDKSLFEQSLVGLNQHLLSKNLPAIAYNKTY